MNPSSDNFRLSFHLRVDFFEKTRNQHRKRGMNTERDTTRNPKRREPPKKADTKKGEENAKGKDAEQNTKRMWTNTETNRETKGEILEPKDEKSERKPKAERTRNKRRMT